MKKIILFVLAILGVGCAHLEQAPLLYSSSVSFGASTGVNATDTPGFNLSLGYKQTDAAYVPVAVAKEGNGVEYGAEDNDLFRVIPIQAVKNDINAKKGGSSEVINEEYRKAKGLVGIKEDRLDNLESELDYFIWEKRDVENNIDELRSSITENNRITRQNHDSLDGDASDLILLQLQEESSKRDRLESQVSELLVEIDRAKEELRLANEDLLEIKRETGLTEEHQGDDSKHDAYSVYGSFDSMNNAFGGSNPESTNALGKVFSTGVAAQTLAEAEKEKALLSGVTNCIKSLQEIAVKLKNPALVSKETILACKRPDTQEQQNLISAK